MGVERKRRPRPGAPMTVQARGRFITLEGGEGVGKSVQAKRLEERLAALGLAVVRTREPGGSPGAEALREAILSGFAAEFGPAGQALLFAAARVDHLDKTILPALASGAWVVSDRFADSTRAYQGAAGNLPPEFIAGLERLTVGAERARPDADPRPRAGSRPQAGGQAKAGQGTCRPVRIGGPALSSNPSAGVPRHRRRRASALRGHRRRSEAKTTSPPPYGRRSRAARSGGRAQGQAAHEEDRDRRSSRSRRACPARPIRAMSIRWSATSAPKRKCSRPIARAASRTPG